jgi:predicted nucleic acid binding AN1-type Zn finger protein
MQVYRCRVCGYEGTASFLVQITEGTFGATHTVYEARHCAMCFALWVRANLPIVEEAT